MNIAMQLHMEGDHFFRSANQKVESSGINGSIREIQPRSSLLPFQADRFSVLAHPLTATYVNLYLKTGIVKTKIHYASCHPLNNFRASPCRPAYTAGNCSSAAHACSHLGVQGPKSRHYRRQPRKHAPLVQPLYKQAGVTDSWKQPRCDSQQ